MAVIRFEVWTRPDTGSFTRKFPLTDIVNWSMEFGIFGRGTIVLPKDYSRVDDILFVDQLDHSNDVASIIRAYIDDTWLYDFYASRASIMVGDTGARTTTITGGGAGASFDRSIVRQFDYPDEIPSVEPDWRYGFGPELVDNGSFEDTPHSIINPDAEEENITGWFTTGEASTSVGVPNSFEAVESAVDAHSGDWYFAINADASEGVWQEFDTVDGSNYVVTVWVKAAAGVTYQVDANNASAATAGTLYNGYVYVEGVGNGAWQQVTLNYTSADVGKSAFRVTSRQTNADIAFDDVAILGFGVGTEPWQAGGLMGTFYASTDEAQDGTYSLKWKTASGIGGNDNVYQSIQVTPNSMITASVWVYHTEGADQDFRLVIRKPGVDPNVSNVASVAKVVPTGVWTQIVATGYSTMPTVEVEVRYDETGIATNYLYADNFVVHHGQDAAALGVILNDLLTAMAGDANRDTLAWLTPTFTDTLDSNGDAWNQAIEVTVKRGQSFRRFCDFVMSEFGYEMRVRVNPADHAVVWFDVYNPEGMGVDYSATDGGAILGAGVVSLGPIIRREPLAAYAMAEGEDQWWGESLNTTLRAVWGDIEAYVGTNELLAGTLVDVADRMTSDKESETITVKFKAPPLTPGKDYVIGDIVRLIFGEDILTAGNYRVISIVIESGDPEPGFQVQFASEGV